MGISPERAFTAAISLPSLRLEAATYEHSVFAVHAAWSRPVQTFAVFLVVSFLVAVVVLAVAKGIEPL